MKIVWHVVVDFQGPFLRGLNSEDADTSYIVPTRTRRRRELLIGDKVLPLGKWQPGR